MFAAITACALAIAAEPVALRLAGWARAYATHTAGAEEYRVAHAIDGNPASHWVGEGHPLTVWPTDVVIAFPEPVTVARIVLLSETLRGQLALKDFEIYAWAGGGWAGDAPIARVRDSRDLRVVLDVAPVRTERLRIRIRDTWRPDHAYPRLREVEVHAAPEGTACRTPRAAPIPDERPSERLLVRRAMGERIVFPGEPYDPAKGFLHYARACLDTLIAEGTDRYGRVQSPMFASLLSMETHRIPEDPPPNVPGQRTGDRAVRGGNLFHDCMMLGACDAVSELTGDAKYRRAATAYLRFFLAHGPQRATGLFPWGEHAHWDFFREAPGHPTHEYLGGVPAAFWERLWAIDPGALRGEGDGLLNHVVDLETFAFDRHADIRRLLPTPRPRGLGYLDFPRHAGFYVGLWTFLGARTGEPRYLDWSLRIIDHVWRARDPRSGLPPASTRTQRARTISVESDLSLAVSLLEAARLLPAGEARTRYEAVAKAFLDAILRLPHRPESGGFLVSFPAGSEVERAEGSYGAPYRYGYGGGFSADDAVLVLAAHRLTGDPRALRLAEAFADYYAGHDPPPPHEIVRAHVYASILGLFVDLHEATRRPAHLAGAERYARLAIERLFHRGLFRGATGIDHYEGDLMVGNLVYNLVRLEAVKRGAGAKVPPNVFNR